MPPPVNVSVDVSAFQTPVFWLSLRDFWGESAMEYIRVTFDPNDIRDVIASGNVIGETETELAVQPNYYVISLSGSGYAPPYWYGVVSGTTSGNR